MDQYQVRIWIGWQHQVLTVLAYWFLVRQKLQECFVVRGSGKVRIGPWWSRSWEKWAGCL